MYLVPVECAGACRPLVVRAHHRRAPPEVLAAGHDRCVIPLRPENLDAWPNPDPSDLLAVYLLLDDRQPVPFSHTLVS